MEGDEMFLGSITWDYFDDEFEAKKWANSLNRKGIRAEYIGEKNGRYVVQKITEYP